jgi:hypothetical protein
MLTTAGLEFSASWLKLSGYERIVWSSFSTPEAGLKLESVTIPTASSTIKTKDLVLGTCFLFVKNLMDTLLYVCSRCLTMDSGKSNIYAITDKFVKSET